MKNNKSKMMFRNFSEYTNICNSHPSFRGLGKIVFMSHAYYPIITLEFDMNELLFEDFVPIQKTILECYQIGFKHVDEISHFLGLPVQYVLQLSTNLEQIQLIKNGAITELGAQALARDRIEHKRNSVQLFQADGCFGILLTKEYYQDKSRLHELYETNDLFLHIKYQDEYKADSFASQLFEIDALKKYKNSVLNTNVDSINDVRFSSLLYSPIFIVWFENYTFPLLFFRTRLIKSAESKPRLDFKPLFYLDDNETLPELDLPILSGEQIRYECLRYANSVVPDEQLMREYFQKRPFVIADQYRYTNKNKVENLCVELEAAVGNISFKDIELLVSACEGNIPITDSISASKGRRSRLVTFVPIINDSELLTKCQIINKFWINDFNTLRTKFTKMERTNISVKAFVDMFISKLEETNG